jgi:hypothetical protein
MTSEAIPGKIIYANEDAPSIPVRPYTGQTYRDTIPDTYDIATRAALGINALTGSANPLADYELYWKVTFAQDPVVMNHDWNDWCQVKFMEALPLLRMLSGSTQAAQVDQVWQDVALKSLGPDGLYYIPMHGRPWSWLSSCITQGVERTDGSHAPMGDPSVAQITHPFLNSRMLGTLLVHWLRDRNPAWLAAIHRIVDRLAELVIECPDEGGTYAYYPVLAYEPNAVYDKTAPQAGMPIHLLGGDINARLPESLGKVYRLTGYEPARALGEKIARYVKYPMQYWGPDGEFLGERHFHAHTIFLLGLLEFAVATGDTDTLQFVRRGYEWAKTTAAGSADAVGFFPEVANGEWPSAESCEIADMIALALRLSAAGVGDYYADAERWTRNHFAEAQLTDSTWVNEQAHRHPAKAPAFNETADRTAERNVGAFAQGSGGNEFWVKGPDGIVHCCTGNGTRTLFYLWRHAVRCDAGTLSVNLLLNHASRWADVYSYIPYRGQVDVRVKQDCADVRIHAPAWVETGSAAVTITLDGQAIATHWAGRYLSIGAVKAGQLVSVRFPIGEHTEHAVMGQKHYDLLIRGDTVVQIDPPGQTGALYQREHYRHEQPRWREVTRFVSDEDVDY